MAVGAKSTLRYGSTVRTLRGGHALITFTNGTKVGLGENSSLEILSQPSAQQPLTVRLSGALSQAWIRPRGNTRVVTAAAGVSKATGGSKAMGGTKTTGAPAKNPVALKGTTTAQSAAP